MKRTLTLWRRVVLLGSASFLALAVASMFQDEYPVLRPLLGRWSVTSGILLAVAALRLLRFHCPRCGELYFGRSYGASIIVFFTQQQCANCGRRLDDRSSG